MGMCWAPNCKHYSPRQGCRFFRFPKHEKERNMWIQAFRRGVPGPGAFICSCHFRDGRKENGPELSLPDPNVIYSDIKRGIRQPRCLPGEEENDRLLPEGARVVKDEMDLDLKELLRTNDSVLLDQARQGCTKSEEEIQQRNTSTELLGVFYPQSTGATEQISKPYFEGEPETDRRLDVFENCQSVQNKQNYVRSKKYARRCSVPHCPLRNGNSRGLKTFAFPTEFTRKQKWLHATHLIKTLNETLPDDIVRKLRVCAAHFREADFFMAGCKRIVRKTALPKLFPCTADTFVSPFPKIITALPNSSQNSVSPFPRKITALPNSSQNSVSPFPRKITALPNLSENSKKSCKSQTNFTTVPVSIQPKASPVNKPKGNGHWLESFKIIRPPPGIPSRIKKLQNRVQVVEKAIFSWRKRRGRNVFVID